MVKELDFNTIDHVVETWELAKLSPPFEEEAGLMILTKLFKLEPRTKLVFGFQQSDDFERASKRLQIGALIHSKRMIVMFDKALSMLGPDTELLTEVLQSLGTRHVLYGVKASYLPIMGQAIIATIKELLQYKVGLWNAEVERSWNTVFEAMSVDIMDAIILGEEEELSESEVEGLSSEDISESVTIVR